MGRTHRSLGLAGTVALSLIVAGCQQKAGGGDPDAARKAVQADEKSWNEQFKSKDSEGLVARYADDAYFVGPGIKGADGSTAIRKVYADALSDKAFSVSFGSDKIDASGDLAYSRGHFTENYTDPKSGKAMTHSGSYVTIYKKQDGGWKVVEDLVLADPDSEKAVEPGKPATRAKMSSF